MISRRRFLKSIVAGAAFFSFGNVLAAANTEKVLNMHNVHTGERLSIKYCCGGDYDVDALARINYFLRCHYTNEVKEIAPNLLDLLCEIKSRVNRDKEIQIISGYRSPAYNEHLVNQGRNVSRNSMHLKGLAIDFAIEGIDNNTLSALAKSFAVGGVGKYPEFVHIDVGRVRYW